MRITQAWALSSALSTADSALIGTVSGAITLSRNQLELPPGFLYRDCAGKFSREIVRHLFNLKLDAHFYPFLTLHPDPFKTIIVSALTRMKSASLSLGGMRR